VPLRVGLFVPAFFCPEEKIGAKKELHVYPSRKRQPMQKNISSILKQQNYQIKSSFWIEFDGNRCFGKGKMQLLELIDKTGSINKAAKEMKMSYKKAWTMIGELNEQFTSPMVITQSGGKEGGGTVLTDEAKTLIQYYQNLQTRFDEFVKMETVKLIK